MTRTNDRLAHAAFVAMTHDDTERQRRNAEAWSLYALGKLAQSNTAPRGIVARARAFFRSK